MNIIITIGGTGAKAGESLVYLMATGLIKGSYEIFIIDKDKNCKNTTDEDAAIQSYQKVHEICNGTDGASPALAEATLAYETLNFDDLLTDLLKGLGINSTEDERRRLDSLRGITKPRGTKNQSNEEALNLVYPKKWQEENLGNGFQGRPFLGTAVFRAIENTTSYKNNTLYTKIRNVLAGGETVKIFLIASIFGGTGATFFPNIAKSIRKEFSDKQDKIQISGALMLPYFSLPDPGNEQDRIIKEEDFHKQAKIAVEQYLTANNLLKQSSDDKNYIFNSLYFMGLSHGKTSEIYSLGGKTQKHKLYIMDLYASLAVCDFFNHFDPNVNEKQIIVPVFPNQNTQSIDWTQLPNAYETKKKMLTLTRFSTFILVYLKPLLAQTPDEVRLNRLIGHLYGKEKSVKNIVKKRLAEISDKQKAELIEQIETISGFCKNYLTKYALEIQSSQTNDGNICNLFNKEGIRDIETISEQGFEKSRKYNLNTAIPDGVISNKGCPSTGEDVVKILMHEIPKEKAKTTNDHKTFIRQLLQQIYEICGREI